MNYSLKQITEITGLSADTLRYYEKEGIVSTKRQNNGYRFFNENDVTILKYIVVMKYAGFSLVDVKKIARLVDFEPGEDCETTIRNLIDTKAAELKSAIRNYQKIIKLLEQSLSIVSCTGALEGNQKAMDEFIGQIFADIQKGEFIK
jgi:MerR family Zn(II)-responsive transcriptional regulator of zntA